MNNRPNLLVVCGKNKKRSRTAEHIFKNDYRFSIRSAGLSPKSTRKISARDLDWADLVLVMESDHRLRIYDTYGRLELPTIVVLDIPDDYEFLDEELMEILSAKINASLSEIYGL